MITLKLVLRANAASCIIFALIFLWGPSEGATFLGGDMPAPEIAFLALGAILMVNGFHLLWASYKPIPSKLLILYFSMGDFIWVIVSMSLFFLELWITTELGGTASILVAIMVAAFGVLQMVKRKEIDNC